MADDELQVRVHSIDAGWTVTASGELDIHSAPRLRRALDIALASGPAVLVMDLTGLRFMSAEGLNILASTQQRCSESSVELGVVLSKPCLRAAELMGMADELPLRAPETVPV